MRRVGKSYTSTYTGTGSWTVGAGSEIWHKRRVLGWGGTNHLDLEAMGNSKAPKVRKARLYLRWSTGAVSAFGWVVSL